MTSGAPAPTRSPLEILRLQLVRCQELLQRALIPRGDAEVGILEVRHQLKRICGDDPAILGAMPVIPRDATPEVIRETLTVTVSRLQTLVGDLDSLKGEKTETASKKIFIGHGRSLVWRELKDFLNERLHLPWDEFNREPVAGYTTVERWSTMLSEASFAFLIMTAEDQHVDLNMHARENVVHEVGLFQGRLGRRRAIILLEETCEPFSNIAGLSVIPFPPGRISAAFEEVRRVLEREGIIGT